MAKVIIYKIPFILFFSLCLGYSSTLYATQNSEVEEEKEQYYTDHTTANDENKAIEFSSNTYLQTAGTNMLGYGAAEGTVKGLIAHVDQNVDTKSDVLEDIAAPEESFIMQYCTDEVDNEGLFYTFVQAVIPSCSSIQSCIALKIIVGHLARWVQLNDDNEFDEIEEDLVKKHHYDNLVGAYHHLLEAHLSTSDSHEAYSYIHEKVREKVSCTFGSCKCYKRNQRNRVIAEEDEYEEYIFLRDLLDTIHVYFVHGDDVNHRFKKPKIPKKKPQPDKGSDTDSDTDSDSSIASFGYEIEEAKKWSEKIDKVKKAKYKNDKFQTRIASAKPNYLNPEFYNPDLYIFGLRLYYWDHYKNSTEKDIGLDAKQQDLYVAPQYESFKAEILGKKGISAEIWAQTLFEAKTFLSESPVLRSIAANGADLCKMYGIQKGAGLTDTHVLAILLYTNFPDLCNSFRASFRYQSPSESVQDVVQRNRAWHYWSKHLREVVEIFGEQIGRDASNKAVDKGSFYHGVPYLLFDGFSMQFYGPVSTSQQLEVAMQCTDMNALVVALKAAEGVHNQGLRFFNVGLLSCFASEDERLFMGGEYPLRIAAIAHIEKYSNMKIQHIAHILFLVDKMINGVSYEGDTYIDRGIFNDLLGNGKDSPSYYNRKAWENFSSKQQKITINVAYMYNYYKDLKPLLFHKERKNLLLFDKMTKLFPEATEIICTHTDYVGQDGNGADDSSYALNIVDSNFLSDLETLFLKIDKKAKLRNIVIETKQNKIEYKQVKYLKWKKKEENKPKTLTRGLLGKIKNKIAKGSKKKSPDKVNASLPKKIKRKSLDQVKPSIPKEIKRKLPDNVKPSVPKKIKRKLSENVQPIVHQSIDSHTTDTEPSEIDVSRDKTLKAIYKDMLRYGVPKNIADDLKTYLEKHGYDLDGILNDIQDEVSLLREYFEGLKEDNWEALFNAFKEAVNGSDPSIKDSFPLKTIIACLQYWQTLNKHKGRSLQEICNYLTKENDYKNIVEAYHHILEAYLCTPDSAVAYSEVNAKVSEQIIRCDFALCTCYLRNQQKSVEKEQEDKDKDQEYIFLRDLLDTIHVYLVHGYDSRHRFKKQKRDGDDDVAEVNEWLYKFDKLKENRKRNYKFQTRMGTAKRYLSERYNPELYIFGLRLYYWPYYKNRQAKDTGWGVIHNRDYHQQDLYVAPQYKSFKAEILGKKGISAEIWAQTMFAAKTFLAKSPILRGIKASGDGLCEQYGIQKETGLTSTHVLAILLYTNFPDLCTGFRASFRFQSTSESVKGVVQRNSAWHYWSKHLREVVEIFGEHIGVDAYNKKVNKGSFYHGMPNVLFDQFSMHFYGPLSTSQQFGVGMRFTDDNALVVELKADTGWADQYVRFFNVGLLSCFAAEDERLFMGGQYPLQIASIRVYIRSNSRQTRYIAHTLFVIDKMIKGARYTGNTNVDRDTFNALLGKYTNNHSLYNTNAWDHFRHQPKKITVNMQYMYKYYKALMPLFFSEEPKPLLLPNKIAALFPNVVQFTCEATDCTGYVHHKWKYSNSIVNTSFVIALQDPLRKLSKETKLQKIVIKTSKHTIGDPYLVKIQKNPKKIVLSKQTPPLSRPISPASKNTPIYKRCIVM